MKSCDDVSLKILELKTRIKEFACLYAQSSLDNSPGASEAYLREFASIKAQISILEWCLE